MSKKIAKLVEVPFSDGWQNELSFDKWLVTNEGLALLAETLGTGELEVIDMQAAVGPFRADVVLQEVRQDDGVQDDGVIVVENQRGVTDHDHLGKMLTYAAGLKARQVVWIAEEFKDEHRAALDWLNEYINSDEKGFTGLEIQLWRIGDSPIAPKFEVISHVNEWSRDIKNSGGTEMEQMLRNYWRSLKDYLSAHHPRIKDIRVRAQSDTALRGLGKGFYQYQIWLAPTRKDVQLLIYFRGRHINAHTLLDDLEKKHKTELENVIGEPLEFHKTRRTHKTGMVRVWNKDVDVTDTKRWNEYHKWFADRLDKFVCAFEPIIKTINPKDYPPPPPE